MTEQQKKIGAVALAVVALGLLIGMVWRNFRRESFPTDYRTLMDKETGELFEVRTEELSPYPMVNPKTGKDTLYRTEICYWGEECRKRGGTHVIMKKLLGEEGPTMCPVCGHVVRFHNPRPSDYGPDRE